MNFDGVARGNSGLAGARCIIRNDKGKCIWALARNVGIASSNEVEFEALAGGLKLCISKGINNIDIEGDSLLCINTVTKNDIQNWKLKKWMKITQEDIKGLDIVSISHVYGEANCIANKLANMGMN
ncbi:hypothetical protein SUGI_0661070 [Cryptomeria japonica]|nr:hypothetical protein SUGI_0661070 [Cryptomeria japonica]